MICHDQFHPYLSENLKRLQLQCFHDGYSAAEFPFGLLQRFKNLEELLVGCGHLKELFSSRLVGKEDKNVRATFARIRYFKVTFLPDLQHIWNQDFPVDQLLPNLESLEAWGCNSLINLAPPTASFQKLKSLDVWLCKGMTYLITSPIAKGLVQLSAMSIRECDMMTEIVASDEGDEGENDITFKQLESLTLGYLSRLTSFCSSNFNFKFPSLTEVIVTACPNMKAFSHGILRTPKLQKVWVSATKDKGQWKGSLNNTIILMHTTAESVLANVEALTLSSIQLENIWQDQSCCIQKLTSLIVEDCGKSKYLFTSSMVRSLAKLKRLEIRDCKMMEEIIVLEGETGSHTLIFPMLEYLMVQDLPKLARFCTADLIECPSLEYLWIENCPEMKTFADISNHMMNNLDAASTSYSTAHEVERTTPYSILFDRKVAFPKLYGLQIFNINGLEMIWHNELHHDSFCKLKTLNVLSGEKLLEIFSPSMLRRSQNLEQLAVYNCDSIKEVFDLQSLMNEKGKSAAMVTQLRVIDIRNLPNLKNVWNGNPQGILSFQNLRSVSVRHCPNLNSIFPASVALGLLQLEALNIDFCGVEEIVSKEEGAEAVHMFVFPNLTFLRLFGLPKLERLYTGMHTSKWPALKQLAVYHCDKIPIFDSSEIQSSQGPWFGDQFQIQVSQPLFSFRQIITNLEELTLTIKDATMICNGQFPSYLFHKLKHLKLQCFHDEYSAVDFPFGLLQSFQNMEALTVGCGHLKELFSSRLVGEEDENTRATLARIRYLRVDFLFDLQHIWNQDFPVDQLLLNLETLEVWNCNSLINLAPPTASFQKLKYLDVYCCKGMTYLITSSTAKNLVQLNAMSIRECDMVTKIVASSEGDEGDEGENEIIFQQLKSLMLHCLPRLTMFCSANFNFKFPSLIEVTVIACPNMKAFSHGILITPMLQKVWVSVMKNKGQWKGDLNNTITHMHAAAEY